MRIDSIHRVGNTTRVDRGHRVNRAGICPRCRTTMRQWEHHTAAATLAANRSETNCGECRIPTSESRRMSDAALLEIDNLKTYFHSDAGTVKAVDGLTVKIRLGGDARSRRGVRVRADSPRGV